MTQLELIEIIQQHHPEAGETAVRKALNRAQDDFSAKTGIIHGIGEAYLNTDVDSEGLHVYKAEKRFYDLDPGMLEIKRVEVDTIRIKKLVNPPLQGDEDKL